jgi:AraC-like DNA-binding protein
MPVAHAHDEIEIGTLKQGRQVMVFGGRRFEIRPGELRAYWGAMPHQVVYAAAGTRAISLNVPVPWLRQSLPMALCHRLLGGAVLADCHGDRLKKNITQLQTWQEDLATGQAERRDIVMLEVQAQLLRLGIETAADDHASSPSAETVMGSSLEHSAGRTLELSRLIAARYTEDLSVTKLSETVGMHPQSAMRLFKRATGMTLVHRLMLHRVSHAQRLLMTSDMKVLDIAMASGFGSLSRFYTAFASVCGQTPAAYRRSQWRNGQTGDGPKDND